MNLESIISITGKSGLFKVISQTKNGLIVESIVDGKRMPVYASEKVSALNDISIYTHKDDMPLKEVYEKMYKKTAGKAAIDSKSTPEELRSYFKEVITDFDEERVYNSDLKKLFLWFNLLIEKKLLKPTEKEEKVKKTEKDKKVVQPKKIVKKPVAKTFTPKQSGAKGGSKTSMPSKKGG